MSSADLSEFAVQFVDPLLQVLDDVSVGGRGGDLVGVHLVDVLVVVGSGTTVAIVVSHRWIRLHGAVPAECHQLQRKILQKLHLTTLFYLSSSMDTESNKSKKPVLFIRVQSI